MSESRELHLARLCAASYAEQPPAPGTFGAVARRTVEADNDLCYVLFREADRTLDVVVRGSDAPWGWNGMMEWLKNCRFFPKRWCGTWVHRGFGNAAEALWVGGLKQMLDEHARWHVSFTGHSRGGSISEALCYRCLHENRIADATTFGAARLWWRGSEPRAVFEPVNYVNEGDPVPGLPLLSCQPNPGRTVRLKGHGHEISAYVAALEGTRA